MPIDPIVTLFEFDSMILELNEVQSCIDFARDFAGLDQVKQLELDRKQTELDEKRALIAIAMADIRSRN